MSRLLLAATLCCALASLAISAGLWLTDSRSMPEPEAVSRLAPSVVAPTESSDGPRLVIGNCMDHLLGKGAVGEKLTSKFEFGNSGNQPLTWKIELGCGCASVTPANGTIPPEGKATIELAVTPRKEGQDEVVSMRLVTNDPARPAVLHRLHARCPSWLSARPPAADFGTIRIGTASEFQCQLLDEDGKPWPDHSKLAIRTSSPHLQAIWVREDPREHRLLIRLIDASKGDFAGQVILEGKDGKGVTREQRIAVSARAVGPFIVAPTTLFLSRRPGQTASLVVRAEDPADLHRLKAAANHPVLQLAQAAPPVGKLLSYRVTVKEGENPTGEKAEITLTLGDKPGETETVRVYWRD